MVKTYYLVNCVTYGGNLTSSKVVAKAICLSARLQDLAFIHSMASWMRSWWWTSLKLCSFCCRCCRDSATSLVAFKAATFNPDKLLCKAGMMNFWQISSAFEWRFSALIHPTHWRILQRACNCSSPNLWSLMKAAKKLDAVPRFRPNSALRMDSNFSTTTFKWTCEVNPKAAEQALCCSWSGKR